MGVYFVLSREEDSDAVFDRRFDRRVNGHQIIDIIGKYISIGYRGGSIKITVPVYMELKKRLKCIYLSGEGCICMSALRTYLFDCKYRKPDDVDSMTKSMIGLHHMIVKSQSNDSDSDSDDENTKQWIIDKELKKIPWRKRYVYLHI